VAGLDERKFVRLPGVSSFPSWFMKLVGFRPCLASPDAVAGNLSALHVSF
jgi:hypothetical protein